MTQSTILLIAVLLIGFALVYWFLSYALDRWGS
jgi:hypothetical protein